MSREKSGPGLESGTQHQALCQVVAVINMGMPEGEQTGGSVTRRTCLEITVQHVRGTSRLSHSSQFCFNLVAGRALGHDYR